MNPEERKLCYDFKAIILLAIPVLITVYKLSGHELIEGKYFEMFPFDLKTLILIAGTIVGILFFIMKYAKFNDVTIKITSRKEFPEVFAIIEKLCNKLKMDVPEVGFLDSSIPNAFLYKRNKRPVLVLTIPLI